MVSEEYFRPYAESLQLKDWGLLKSSLQKRIEATRLMKNDNAYYRLGKANEMILLGFHIGDGIQARAACLEALKDLDNNGLDSFLKLDKEWEKQVGFSVLRDCLDYAILWSDSFDEAIKYCQKLIEYFSSGPNQIRQKRLEELQKQKKTGSFKWVESQRNNVHSFASRTTSEMDNGKYAPAMSILQCIMQNINDSKKGYVFDNPDEAYLTYEDCLDDCLSFSIAYMGVISKKYVAAFKENKQQMQHINPATEQGIIFDNTLKLWIDFMPECLPKDNYKYRKYYELLLKCPATLNPELLQRLSVYFPDVYVPEKPCPHCGNRNSVILSVCGHCRKSVLESNQLQKENLDVKIQKPAFGCSVFNLIVSVAIATYLWYLIGSGDTVWYKVLGAILVSLFALFTVFGWILNKKR